MNDQNFVLSVLTLEELGATGNKVCLLCVMLFGLGLLWPCAEMQSHVCLITVRQLVVKTTSHLLDHIINVLLLQCHVRSADAMIYSWPLHMHRFLTMGTDMHLSAVLVQLIELTVAAACTDRS